jgi:hypothetical protein
MSFRPRKSRIRVTFSKVRIMQTAVAEKLDMQTFTDWLALRPGQKLTVTRTDVASGAMGGLRLRLDEEHGGRRVVVAIDRFRVSPKAGHEVRTQLRLDLVKHRDGDNLQARQCRWDGRRVDLPEAALTNLTAELARMVRMMKTRQMPSLGHLDDLFKSLAGDGAAGLPVH